jgi:hypothetical protein
LTPSSLATILEIVETYLAIAALILLACWLAAGVVRLLIKAGRALLIAFLDVLIALLLLVGRVLRLRSPAPRATG